MDDLWKQPQGLQGLNLLAQNLHHNKDAQCHLQDSRGEIHRGLPVSNFSHRNLSAATVSAVNIEDCTTMNLPRQWLHMSDRPPSMYLRFSEEQTTTNPLTRASVEITDARIALISRQTSNLRSSVLESLTRNSLMSDKSITIPLAFKLQERYENSKPHEPGQIAKADLFTPQGKAQAKSVCYLLVTLKLQLVAV